MSNDVENVNISCTESSRLQENETEDKESFVVRRAKAMGRNPWTHLLVGFFVSTAIGVVGMTVGKFSIAVDNDGWRTRGTLISERQQQIRLVLKKRNDLFEDTDGSLWEELKQNVQPNIFVRIRAQDNRRLVEADVDTSDTMDPPSRITLSNSTSSSDYCDNTWYVFNNKKVTLFSLVYF